MKIVTFDLEIVHSPSEPGYSWGKPEDLGISVACTHSDQDGYLDWFGHEVPGLLAYLAEHDRVIGFNIGRFDFPVMDGALGLSKGHTLGALRGKTFDLLACILQQTGHRVKLSSLAAGLNETKAMDGAQAPAEWSKRKRLEVIRYCRQDVGITRKVYDAGLAGPILALAVGFAPETIHVTWEEYSTLRVNAATFNA